jgi:hypothetical protein
VSITQRYRFDRAVGRGGMGTVWLATDLLLGRTVAIKDVLLPAHATQDERLAARDRVLREAHAAARINHPAVVTVHDVVEEGERLFLVMEYVAAWSLEQIVQQQGALPPTEVAALGARIAGALAGAHRLGVIHRDVKPSNVLLPAGGASAKLVDFGIAALADSPHLTANGMVMGSPSYMAPEQAEGSTATAATDVFALGVTLFYAAEGATPFDRESTMATLAAVVTQPPAAPTRPGPLADVVLAMLDKDPARRPSVDEIVRRLDEIATGRPTAPVRPGFPDRDWVVPTATATPPAGAPAVRPAAAARESLPPPPPVPAVRPDTRLVPSLQDRPAPETEPAPSHRGRLVLATVGIVVLAALLAVGVVLTGDATEQTKQTRTAAAAAALTTTAADTTTTAPAEEAAAVPAGFVQYVDPQGGFAMAVPEGMDVQVDEGGHTTVMTSDDVRIAVRWFAPAVDPVDFLRTEQRRLAAFPAYAEARFEGTPFGSFPGALWEFDFAQNSNSDVLLHQTGRAFLVGGGSGEQFTFSLFLRARATDFAQLQQQLFSVVEGTFDPSATSAEFAARAARS